MRRKYLAAVLLPVMLCLAGLSGCGDVLTGLPQGAQTEPVRDVPTEPVDPRSERYAMGLELMEAGDYAQAYEIFDRLGDYQDAADRAQEALHWQEAVDAYAQAGLLYNTQGVAGDIETYRILAPYADCDYGETAELLEDLRTRLYQTAVQEVTEKNSVDVRAILKAYDEFDPGLAGELRTELIVLDYLEPDYSYYDNMSRYNITSFSINTTAEEFATLFRTLYLTEWSKLVLLAEGTIMEKDDIQAINDLCVSGLCMIGTYLPEYFSIYGGGTGFSSSDDGILIGMAAGYDTAKYSEEELAQHAEIMEKFCEDSLRLLNDSGLLTPGMSSREKAAVILDWVDYYLDYDYALEIYDAGVAVQERLGVCQTYQALYHRICVLAGIPSYGHRGTADNGTSNDAHIWSVQLDESGGIFYTDPTWADISENKGTNTHNGVKDLDGVFTLFLGQYGKENWTNNEYFWQTACWSSHHPMFDELFPDIPNE